MPPVDHTLLLAARVVGAVLFGMSAWHHTRDLAGFRAAIEGYRLLPGGASGVVALAIIAAEACIAVSLASGLLLYMGALVAVCLLALFAAAIAINLLRGRTDIDCGCSWARGGTRLGWGLVLRNGLIIALLATLLAPVQGSPGALQVIDGIGAGLAVLLGYHIAGEFLSLARRSKEGRRVKS